MILRYHDRTRRRAWIALSLAALIAGSALADEAHLTLAEVQKLALERQPLLESQLAEIAAARDRALAARQLPDPELKLGVQNLPVDTADAWRFDRDSMTQSMVGLMQAFPFPGKRALRGESESLKAEAGDAALAALRRAIQRDAGLAYLEVLLPHEAGRLVRAQIAEAQKALGAALIAYRNGSRPQSEVLAARAALGMLADKQADYEQKYAVALADLRRWTGALPDFVPMEPDEPPIPPLSELLAGLTRHPERLAADRDVERARVDWRLAKKSRQPDFNVELDYGYRAEFSDMVSLQVGIPLPVFPAQRQDRDIAAAAADLDARRAAREDLERRLQAEVGGLYQKWQALGARLARYRSDVLPPLDARVAATLAEYQSGSGSIGPVLDARQALLDARLSLLELRLERLRAALQLHYYAME